VDLHVLPRPEIGGESVESVESPGDKDEIRARYGEAACELGTYPRAGACDENSLVVMAKWFHGFLSRGDNSSHCRSGSVCQYAAVS
jgi:hypothetical protein